MSKMPVRIQLRRTRGWRLQPTSLAINGLDAVKIDRTTKWGNPFVVANVGMSDSGDIDDDGQPIMVGPWCCREKDAPEWAGGWYFPTKREALVKAIELYRVRLARDQWLQDGALEELRWKNLACWCAEGEGEPCHGDVLIEFANRRIKP